MRGADEVDDACDLIKGYGRALVREKIVEAAAFAEEGVAASATSRPMASFA